MSKWKKIAARAAAEVVAEERARQTARNQGVSLVTISVEPPPPPPSYMDDLDLDLDLFDDYGVKWEPGPHCALEESCPYKMARYGSGILTNGLCLNCYDDNQRYTG